MSHWLYEGKNFDTIPNGHFGFIYLITNTQSGRKYIGRKYFYSTRRIKVKGRKTRKDRTRTTKIRRGIRRDRGRSTRDRERD